MPKATMVPGLEYQLPGEVQVEGTHGKAKLRRAWRTRGRPCAAFIARTRFLTSSGAISFDGLKFECVLDLMDFTHKSWVAVTMT